MPIVKRIVCLANSRKTGERCVAGREWNGAGAGVCIRPVSARPHEEVSEHERQYEDGSDPRVLDIIDVPLIALRPRTYQRENWLLDPTRPWVRRGRAGWDDLAGLADAPAVLWRNGFRTHHGSNDRVPQGEAESLTTSLHLLHVSGLLLSVFAPGQEFDNPTRKLYGRFRHAGVDYRLRVTDPIYERAYLAKANGNYMLGECYVTVSLGEPWEGYCYKLIAAIIERTGGVRE